MCPSCSKHLGSNPDCVFCQDAKSSVESEEKAEHEIQEYRRHIEILRQALLQEVRK